MKPDERDLAYLWDMLDAARRIERLTDGLDYAGFVDDERTSLAVERLLENVGEAARHVSSELQFCGVNYSLTNPLRNSHGHQV